MMLVAINAASQTKGETDLDGAQQYYGNSKTSIIAVKEFALNEVNIK